MRHFEGQVVFDSGCYIGCYWLSRDGSGYYNAAHHSGVLLSDVSNDQEWAENADEAIRWLEEMEVKKCES